MHLDKRFKKCLNFPLLFHYIFLYTATCLATYGAIEALRMVIIIEGLCPAVTSFYWEPTGDTFCCEELVPILMNKNQYRMFMRLSLPSSQ